MNKWILMIGGLICLLVLSACSGAKSSSRVYGYYGHGPWWGHRSYHDRVIVVPPGGGGGPAPERPVEPPVAEQLPIEPPMEMPDMGMPEADIGGVD